MQGKYARFHRALMTRTAPLGRNFLEETARDSGMDVEKARADAESKAVADQIKYNRVTGLSKGIRGTPAILVGNKLVQGAVEFERLRQMVAEARSAR
jgi:protein-disulfide isomerase